MLSGLERGSNEAKYETISRLYKLWNERRGAPQKVLTWNKFRSDNFDTVYEEVISSGVERGSAEASHATTAQLLNLWKEKKPVVNRAVVCIIQGKWRHAPAKNTF